MAGVEPYSPCPCGSGQKFKWCCHKVEAFADKAQRLLESGQFDAAIKVLDEGLRKEPGNPWLLVRKAIVQINLDKPEAAKATLGEVLHKNPKHFGALVLLTRCILEIEGPVHGAGMLQQTLSSVDESLWPQMAMLARIIAMMMERAGMIPAAIRHFELVASLDVADQGFDPALLATEVNPAHSPWLKDHRELAPPPANLDPAARQRFEEALTLGAKGLWASAAAAFDQLSTGAPGGEADYNLGLCRLWLGDEDGAVGPLRRRSRLLGRSVEAVDLECLCQLIEPMHPDDRVEQVQLIWPLRNRAALLETLRSKPDIHDEGSSPEDPDDAESAEVDSFALLDRPALASQDGRKLTPDDIPRILGRVIVAKETAALETYDDGRVDALGDRFTALAGSAIAPAHPRTKVLGEQLKSALALAWEWLYPLGMLREEARRIESENRVKVLRELWPKTPSPVLGFRTPERAARDGDAEVPLRAMLCQLEYVGSLQRAGLDLVALRVRLNLPPEPAIDPSQLDVSKLAIGRMFAVPVEQLEDERLVEFYRRARRFGLHNVIESSARAIIGRPRLFEAGEVSSLTLYGDLSKMALSRGEQAEAASWLTQGRQADLPAVKAINAPAWDMLEVRQKMTTEPPEVWVAELAIVLDRYSNVSEANSLILMHLIELGLVNAHPNPDDPGDVILDTRRLQAILARYGPKVTTSSGRLGVSAAKPELWTPESATATSGGGIWTPGSSAANPTPADRPKLILPGR